MEACDMAADDRAARLSLAPPVKGIDVPTPAVPMAHRFQILLDEVAAAAGEKQAPPWGEAVRLGPPHAPQRPAVGRLPDREFGSGGLGAPVDRHRVDRKSTRLTS